MRPARKRNGKGRKAVQIVLSLLLVLNLVILLLQGTTGRALLQKAPALLPVSGGSMEPKYHDGDAILVVPAAFESLETDDIVVFYRENQLIVHQIIARSDETLITKGTANSAPDAPVSKEEYRAKAVCRLPLVGSIWLMYSSLPLFLGWTALLILLIFGVDLFPALYERIRKHEE